MQRFNWRMFSEVIKILCGAHDLLIFSHQNCLYILRVISDVHFYRRFLTGNIIGLPGTGMVSWVRHCQMIL